MAKLHTTLKAGNTTKDEVYPNIESENIPAKAVTNAKLDDYAVTEDKINGEVTAKYMNYVEIYSATGTLSDEEYALINPHQIIKYGNRYYHCMYLGGSGDYEFRSYVLDDNDYGDFYKLTINPDKTYEDELFKCKFSFDTRVLLSGTTGTLTVTDYNKIAQLDSPTDAHIYVTIGGVTRYYRLVEQSSTEFIFTSVDWGNGYLMGLVITKATREFNITSLPLTSI